MTGIVEVKANIATEVFFRTDDAANPPPDDTTYVVILRAQDADGNKVIPLSVVKAIDKFTVIYPDDCTVDWRINEDTVSYDPILP